MHIIDLNNIMVLIQYVQASKTLSNLLQRSCHLDAVSSLGIFAGTLYAMALGAPRILGAVTPIGGLGLMAGWSLLAWQAYRAGLGKAKP